MGRLVVTRLTLGVLDVLAAAVALVAMESRVADGIELNGTAPGCVAWEAVGGNDGNSPVACWIMASGDAANGAGAVWA